MQEILTVTKAGNRYNVSIRGWDNVTFDGDAIEVVLARAGNWLDQAAKAAEEIKSRMPPQTEMQKRLDLIVSKSVVELHCNQSGV